MSNKSQVSVCFTVPITTAGNAKEVRAAYTELRKQIVQFANAITRDPNVVVTHSVMSNLDETNKAAIANPANGKIAELQSVSVPRVPDTAKTPKKKREIPEPDVDEDEEKPRVQAGEWTPSIKSADSKKPLVSSEPAVATAKLIDTKAVTDKIFTDLKRTGNSVTIVEYLVSNHDKELTPDDIITGTKLERQQVSNWLAITGDRIPGLEKVKRGVYKFVVK